MLRRTISAESKWSLLGDQLSVQIEYKHEDTLTALIDQWEAQEIILS